jgi:hypothetical protein
MTIKTKYLLIIHLIIYYNINSQNLVLEYNNDYAINFKIYKSNENILKKTSNFLDISKSTPEGLAQSYFFATNDDWNKSNYLDPKDYQQKNQKNYDAIKKLNKDKNFIKILHKFSFIHEGNEMCYIMFIAELEGIDFKFPTCLTCIKKENKWYISSFTNQYKIEEIMLTFKSFRLLQLINGEKTNNAKMDDLIKKTRTKESFLDIDKLYTETNTWEYLGSEQKYFTNMVDNECDDVNNYELSNKKVNFTTIFKSANVKNYEKSDQNKLLDLRTKIKSDNNNDSIYINSKLDFEYANKKYSVIKYKQINSVNKSILKIKVQDNSLDITIKPVYELIYVFENLNSQIFNDLSSSLSMTEDQKSEFLYKNTRGNFDSLNISKLYDLLKKDKSFFSKYLVESPR